jgi:hypothetical protein
VLAQAPTANLLTVEVHEDGTVSFELPRIEVGQGITTTVAMLIAEEMYLPLAKVKVKVTLADSRPELVFGSTPTLVSPLVALLCHESCPVSGETFLSGGRRHARLVVAETEGYVHPDVDLTPEVVAKHWAQIMNESVYYVPADTSTWFKANAERIAATPIMSPA